MEITVAYPFLLKVYEDYGTGVIDKKIFIAVLELVQSYAWRRFIVGLGTEGRSKVFMTLYDKIEDKNNYLEAVQTALLKLSGSNRLPRNTETLNALKEKDMYNIKPKNRAYFFERIENFNNREYVKIDDNSDITVEHIFPQNPSPKWALALPSKEYGFIKETLLNTIGNLTLSGNNGALGNSSFLEKRDMNKDDKEQGYKFSRLWLNQRLKTLESWGRAEIEQRSQEIAERFLKIWSIPDIQVESVDNLEVNIFDAESPVYKKLDYAVFFGKKIEVKEVAKLYTIVFKQLFELAPEAFEDTEIAHRIGLTKNCTEGSPRQAISINETYFIEGNMDNANKFDRIKQALTVLNLEEELFIKYAREAAEEK